jgi:hypothetical protein
MHEQRISLSSAFPSPLFPTDTQKIQRAFLGEPAQDHTCSFSELPRTLLRLDPVQSCSRFGVGDHESKARPQTEIAIAATR